MNLRIYVFSPYRASDPAAVHLNALRAIEVAEKLARAGFSNTFVPHLYLYWDEKFQHPHEFWIEKCLREVKLSGVLVGSGVMSEGCEIEVAEARVWGIPVYWTADEFLEDYAVAKKAAKEQFGIGG
jgi:hypothetical protein